MMVRRWKIFYLSDAEIIHIIGGASSKASAQFATLMMCESISKLIEKYYGLPGKLAYKLVVLFGSCIRIYLLNILMILKFITIKRQRRNVVNSFNKYISMIKWGLGLLKPVIK